ncbi:MAG: lytic transglycosylase domain-containing protein [Anaerolineales bacterium]
MKPSHLAVALVALSLVLLTTWPTNVGFVMAGVEEPESPEGDPPSISPYWHPRVQQWNALILEEAQSRSLDPDFLASLLWMESRGYHDAVGPVGAVGLMQVMPKEAGFTWRPSRDLLFDPAVNLFWGTRTLATVVHQGQGDIFNALAAYNGGWEQIQYRGPRIFATTILRDYARAVALRHGLRPSDEWVALFAVRGVRTNGPIWVADSSRDDVYFYSRENWVPEGYPLIPEHLPPVSIVARCEKEDGRTYDVGIWLYLEREGEWVAP